MNFEITSHFTQHMELINVIAENYGTVEQALGIVNEIRLL